MLNIKKILKGLRLLNDVDQTKAVEITPISASTTNTKTSINVQQTANRTLSTPLDGLTGELVTTNSTQSLSNKTIDADVNPITNIDNADIKANAGIDATKIADGSVTNAEFQRLNAVISPVVDTTQTQTLTNKTLVVANNTITTAPSSGLVATELNAALAELQFEIEGIIATAGANTALSNLVTTSINQNLLPDATLNLRDFGSPTQKWQNLYLDKSVLLTASNRLVGPNEVVLTPSLNANVLALLGSNVTGLATSGVSGASNSSRIFVESGNTDSGTSGDISLRVGSTVTGARGSVIIDTPSVQRRLLSVEVVNEEVGKNISLTSGATNATISQFTTSIMDYPSIIIRYLAKVGSEKRTGTLHISATSTTAAIADTYVETAPTTLSFSVVATAGILTIRQTNTEIGAITISYNLLKFKE